MQNGMHQVTNGWNKLESEISNLESVESDR